MTYYNNLRLQWNLKKVTPVQYRNHLLQVAGPFLKNPLHRVQFNNWLTLYYEWGRLVPKGILNFMVK